MPIVIFKGLSSNMTGLVDSVGGQNLWRESRRQRHERRNRKPIMNYERYTVCRNLKCCLWCLLRALSISLFETHFSRENVRVAQLLHLCYSPAQPGCRGQGDAWGDACSSGYGAEAAIGLELAAGVWGRLLPVLADVAGQRRLLLALSLLS